MIEFIIESRDDSDDLGKTVIVMGRDGDDQEYECESYYLDGLGWLQLLDVLTHARLRSLEGKHFETK